VLNRKAAGVLLVFAAALLITGWHLDAAGIAAPYSDPIAQLRAQDEAIYVNAAMRMARDGDWMTPHILGRVFLEKPPLLFWIAALSIRLFGLSLFAIRLPVLVLGAVGVAAIYAWCMAKRSIGAGILAAGLLVLSPFWEIFARLYFTDIPASAFAVLAMSAVAFDLRLERRLTPILFGLFGALSILSKSVAGLLPFAALVLYWIFCTPAMRPRIARLAITGIAGVIVLAPWFVYQIVAHPQWFWADYVQVQLLGIGLQTGADFPFSRSSTFYLSRMAQMDPVTGLLALLAIPGAIRELRARRDPMVLLICCWIVVVAAGMFAFHTKNLPYLVLLMPPLCLLAGMYGPVWLSRDARVAAVLIVGLFAARMIVHGAPWSLRPASSPLEGAAAMREYYALGRNTELMSCDPDDQFYSSTLPLPRVSYCFVDPHGVIARSFPHYAPLGIVIPAEQFLILPSLAPQFKQRLHEWRYDSTEPIASGVTLASPDQIAEILRARPDMDFSLPASWAPFFGTTHEVWKADHHVFLLSRTAPLRQRPVPALPNPW